MKSKISILLFIFGLSLNAQYNKKMSKDKNGYSYEHYEGDPIGLRVYTLKNGLKVYLSKNENKPEIVTNIVVNAGSNDDPRDNTGLAHYFEHMMFKGTSKIGTSNWEKEKPLLDKIEQLFEKHKKEKNPDKKKEIYSEIDKLSNEASKYAIHGELDKIYSTLGASGTNAYTSYDKTVYVNTIPKNELERWLTIEKERVSNVVLRVFHTELETVYEEYNMGQDDYMRSLLIEMFKESFKGSNYSVSVIGKPEHLKNPSMTSIYNFAKEFYVPNNMAIILSGDLDYENSIKLVDQTFGKLIPNKNLKKQKFDNAKKLNGEVSEVVDMDIEKVLILFREKTKTDNEKYLTLINFILSSKIGLLNTDIINQQKLLSASSFNNSFKHYYLQALLGIPKPNMTLEETNKILWDEIEKIKKGDFDRDIIPATINDMKIYIMNSYENNSYSGKLIDCFINGISWKDELEYLDELSKIDINKIINYAKQNLVHEKSLTIYKRKGEKKNIVKVEKPKITSLTINRDSKSKFFEQLDNMKVSEEIKPQDPDFSLIKNEKLDELDYNHVLNTKNDLFFLSFEYPIGYYHNDKLSLAIDYFSLLGTNKKTLSEVEKEFYVLGIKYGFSGDKDKVTISLSGLSENMEKGLNLYMEYLNNLKADETKYKSMIDDILKIREEEKNNPKAISKKMFSYALYGDNSPERDILSKEVLQKINPNSLIEIIQSFKNIKPKVFYYGKNSEKVKDLVKKNIKTKGDFSPIPPKKNYVKNTAKNNIYFVNKKDMVQIQINDLGLSNIYYNEDNEIYSRIYNDYFGSGLSSIVFQEIREARSLSYSAFVILQMPTEKEEKAIIISGMMTQPDKLLYANKAMEELLLNMPKNEISFNNAKISIQKNIATSRVSEREIYYLKQKLEKLGINKPYNVHLYNKFKEVSFDGLNKFVENNIKNNPRDMILIGNKESINLEELSKQTGKKVIELDLNHLFNY